MIVAGAFIGTLTSKGFQLPWNETQVAEAITTLVFAILAYYDAKYPNTILDKKGTQETQVTIVTTDELSDAIQQATQETETEVEEVEVDVGDDQQ